MMHGKSVVVDGILSIFGSANFDNRSLELNDELNVAVFSPSWRPGSWRISNTTWRYRGGWSWKAGAGGHAWSRRGSTSGAISGKFFNTPEKSRGPATSRQGSSGARASATSSSIREPRAASCAT